MQLNETFKCVHTENCRSTESLECVDWCKVYTKVIDIFFFRVQVLKLWLFPYMHQECQAFEQLPDWKKQHLVDISGYNSFLLRKEQCREAYKDKLASQTMNFDTLDKIEQAISEQKQAVDSPHQYDELLSVSRDEMPENCDDPAIMLAEFEPVQYAILDVEQMSVHEAGAVVQQEVLPTADLHTDLTFMEMNLSELFGPMPPTAESVSCIPCEDNVFDHSYAQMNSAGSTADHGYAKSVSDVKKDSP